VRRHVSTPAKRAAGFGPRGESAHTEARESPAAGASFPRDQATRLRELAGTARRSATTIAIISGKGGVGKTNVAVNLAICLAGRGLRVALVDLDMGLANADVLMNLRTRYTLLHVVSGQRTIDEVCTAGPAGIRFVAGASGFDQLANLSEFERRNLISWLETLEDNTDIVVLDCGAGISRNVVSFATAADRVIVVTTPQPTSLTDAYAMVKVLHRESCKGSAGLFVNMAESRAEAHAAYRRLASVAERFLNYSVADAGYMLHDTTVELAVCHRDPFVIRYPNSNASACIAAMADQLARTASGPLCRGGFFKRVVGLFV
jgi:flagellar biosynthesis protein FlhG